MSFLTTIKSLLGLKPKGPSVNAGDRVLTCADCQDEFVFDAGEQRFFKSKGFTDPKRCPECRQKLRTRSRRRGRGRDHRRSRDFNQRHSVIDGDSPYADER